MFINWTIHFTKRQWCFFVQNVAKENYMILNKKDLFDKLKEITIVEVKNHFDTLKMLVSGEDSSIERLEKLTQSAHECVNFEEWSSGITASAPIKMSISELECLRGGLSASVFGWHQTYGRTASLADAKAGIVTEVVKRPGAVIKSAPATIKPAGK